MQLALILTRGLPLLPHVLLIVEAGRICVVVVLWLLFLLCSSSLLIICEELCELLQMINVPGVPIPLVPPALMTKLDDGREPPEGTVAQVMSFLDDVNSGSVRFHT